MLYDIGVVSRQIYVFQPIDIKDFTTGEETMGRRKLKRECQKNIAHRLSLAIYTSAPSARTWTTNRFFYFWYFLFNFLLPMVSSRVVKSLLPHQCPIPPWGKALALLLSCHLFIFPFYLFLAFMICWKGGPVVIVQLLIHSIRKSKITLLMEKRGDLAKIMSLA